MDNQEIIIGILEVSVVAILSCAIFFYLNNNLGVKPKTILIINLVCMGAIPLYGIIAMRQKWEFYLLVFIFGLQTGSQQAFTRSIFSACIPKGMISPPFFFFFFAIGFLFINQPAALFFFFCLMITVK